MKEKSTFLTKSNVYLLYNHINFIKTWLKSFKKLYANK